MTDEQRALMLEGIVHDADRMDTIRAPARRRGTLVAGRLEPFHEQVDLRQLVVELHRENLRRDPDHPRVEWRGSVGVDPRRPGAPADHDPGLRRGRRCGGRREGRHRGRGRARGDLLRLRMSRAGAELDHDGRRPTVRAAASPAQARAARSASSWRAASWRRRAAAPGPRSRRPARVPSRAADPAHRPEASAPGVGRGRLRGRLLDSPTMESGRGCCVRSRRSASGPAPPSPAAPTLEALEAAQTAVMGRQSRFGELQRVAGLDGRGGPPDRRRRRQRGPRGAAAAAAETAAALEAVAEEALLAADRLDLTLPGRRPRPGSLHPLTLAEHEIVDIFTSPRLPRRGGPRDRGRLAQLPGAQHPARSSRAQR